MPPSRSNKLLAGYPLTVAGLLVVVFVAFFRRCSEFGLYGDDPAFFGGLINRNWTGEIDNVWFCLTKWPQGRPLGMGLNLNLIPYLIFHLAGLTGLYVAAFLIVAANCTLLFRLVGQFHPPLVALSAAGFYALAPADTVQLSLVYAYNFEITVLFGILSAWAALRGRQLWFVLTLGIGLLMVEPVAMFALLAPLFLTFRRDRAWMSWAVRLVMIWVGVVLAVLIARRLIGDPWGSERVSEITTNPLITFQHGLTSAFTGFRTHFDLVLERLLQPLKEADAGLWLVMLGAGTITALLVRVAQRQGMASELPAGSTSSAQAVSEPGWWPGLRLLLAGCAIMLAVYFCYFRTPWYPANWRTGFMSGVHVVAALGSCLVFAALVSLLAAALPLRMKPAVGVLPVLAFTSLTGFGNLVQQDYANNWAFQRNFWQAYARLCPDATDGTFVLVLDRNLPHSRYIDLFSWGSEILPDALFQYRKMPVIRNQPAAGGIGAPVRPPVVILTAPELATAIRYDGQRYFWKPTYYFMLPKTPQQQPEADNVIGLVYDGHGNWRRLTGDIAVDGGTLALRPLGGEDKLRQGRKSPLAAVYGL